MLVFVTVLFVIQLLVGLGTMIGNGLGSSLESPGCPSSFGRIQQPSELQLAGAGK